MKRLGQNILIGSVFVAALMAAMPAKANFSVPSEDIAASKLYNALPAPAVPAPAVFFEKTLYETYSPASNHMAIKVAQKKVSPAKAKSIARSQVKGGEVVDISLKKSTYRVRVISKSGRVVDVLIDANTGRVK